MPRRKKQFSLTDFGVQLPDLGGLAYTGAVDPLEAISIFAPMSGQQDAQALINSSQIAQGQPQQQQQSQQRPSARPAQQGQTSEEIMASQLSDDDVARRIQLSQKEAAVQRAIQRGGFAGFGGLIATIAGGKRREELKALNIKAAQAEEAEKNLRLQQKIVDLERSKDQATIGKHQVIQSEQVNTYEELNNANLMNGLKDMPEEVLASKLKTAGIVRNTDGSLPTFQQDLNAAFGKEKISKWAMAHEGFRKNLKSLYSVDPDLRKPLLDSLAQARQASRLLEKDTLDIATARFSLKNAKGQASKDNLTKVNRVFDSIFDNAAGLGRAADVTDENIPLMNAALTGQTNSMLRFLDKEGIPVFENTRKWLSEPTAPAPDAFFNALFSSQRDSQPAVPLRLNEAQERYLEDAADAQRDISVQIQKAVKNAGGTNRREGNVVDKKDPRKKPVVSSDESVPKTGNLKALEKRRRELIRKSRRK